MPRQAQAVTVGCWGTAGSGVAGSGHLLPITLGSFGEGFGVRPSPGCFLPATRKKLFELARAFSEKTKMRKSKRKHLLRHQLYPEGSWGAAGGLGLSWGMRMTSCRGFWRHPKATGWPEPPGGLLWLGPELGRDLCPATQRFSLAGGTGWGQQLPQPIFLMMLKDIHVVRNAMLCHVCCAQRGVPWCPALSCPMCSLTYQICAGAWPPML